MLASGVRIRIPADRSSLVCDLAARLGGGLALQGDQNLESRERGAGAPGEVTREVTP